MLTDSRAKPPKPSVEELLVRGSPRSAHSRRGLGRHARKARATYETPVCGERTGRPKPHRRPHERANPAAIEIREYPVQPIVGCRSIPASRPIGICRPALAVSRGECQSLVRGRFGGIGPLSRAEGRPEPRTIYNSCSWHRKNCIGASRATSWTRANNRELEPFSIRVL